MRVAAIYDIHGNLPALEAVLDELHAIGVDQVIVGGDVLPGPMPGESLRLLRDLDLPVRFIHGNGDREVLAQMAGEVSDWYAAAPPEHREPVRWTAERLHSDHEATLANWPATTRLEIAGLGSVLFCHATPRNDTECFTRRTSDEHLAPVFAGVDASVVVCGHTHMQFDRTVGDVRVVNAGSVGMPFGEPGAYWLLLAPGVELQRTVYDRDDAASRIRATDYPQAAEFADRFVLNPPSEDQMLEVFSAAELR